MRLVEPQLARIVARYRIQFVQRALQLAHFNDGIAPDPDLSPFGTFPFFAADDSALLEAEPGVVLLSLVLTDDDAGADGDSSDVIVVGNATTTEGSGWWKHQYSGKGLAHVDADLADAYRQIVDAVSSVFSEDTDASDGAAVHDILSPNGGDKRARARAELMVAWLHFASGGVPWNAVVPLQGGDSADFLDLMFDAEVAILDPGASDAELVDLAQDLSRVRFAE